MKILKVTLLLLTCIAVTQLTATNKSTNIPINNPQKENTMNVIELTQEEFLKKVYNFNVNPDNWKYEGDKPCIIDFYATWCGPCKALAPRLEEVAKEYEGKIYIYKVDVDKESELAALFGIRSIPTLLYCPLIGEPQLISGSLSKEQLQKTINTTLLKTK
ncbi:thioredoxin [Parabacteroides pacaensis]|uniref:thioredoxin n=1 Tax=Parabacteroides pacaensis TaxID=2086575 RepID=UPI000D0FF1EA|nr:thioredoxin [Parabacteroides pacaensis]